MASYNELSRSAHDAGGNGQIGRLRIVVVDHEGGEMTFRCVERLLATRWPGDLQVVVVDNGSVVGIAAEFGRRFPAVEVRRSDTNRGFAGGSNLGLRDLDEVEYIALANNDLLVEPGWLEPLLRSLEEDDRAGTASPKMLLADKFVELELSCEQVTRRRGDRRVLGVRLSGARRDGVNGDDTAFQPVDGFFGPERSKAPEGQFEWTGQRAVLRVPAPLGARRSAALRLGADEPGKVTVRSGDRSCVLDVRAGVDWYEVELGGDSVDVINNTGTVLRPDGYGADRGYLEIDHGQYDTAEPVFAWCGGAVLMRSSYLADVGLFDERLFLYYEDLELALRGRDRGWRYVYNPTSAVRHQHAATAITGSTRAEFYKERNRLLVLARHSHGRRVVKAAARFILSTASYARRDIVAPMLQLRRPQPAVVIGRVRALMSFLRLAPSMRRDRRRQTRRAATRPATDRF